MFAICKLNIFDVGWELLKVLSLIPTH
jgi:hypothetical protein